MESDGRYDVIIIGGSYAGLSAAMALGRALRKVLVIDSGLPCNRQTPHSHNFLTQDGERPADIAAKAKAQVMVYDTVQFVASLAVSGAPSDQGYAITVENGKVYEGTKLIFATGVKDLMPTLEGFAACWGISILHCPYCHGYEVKDETTGILANGDTAWHLAQLISNWSKDLTIFTNGAASFTPEQKTTLYKHGIAIIEQSIAYLKHTQGKIEQVVFNDHTAFNLTALYARPDFEQHCLIPQMLGCKQTDTGLLKVDMFQKTTVKDVFVCGDAASPMRSVSYAVASGNIAGSMLNNEMTTAAFNA